MVDRPPDNRGPPDQELAAATHAAAQAQVLLAGIVESCDDAILSNTLDGVVRSWNKGAERIFGYTAAESIGRPITLIIPPERLDEARDILARLTCGERVEHFETVRVDKDGRRLDISLTVSPLRDDAGRVIGASSVARDVTARRSVEAALRLAEERSEFVRRASGVGFWYCDLPFEVLQWDERVKAHFHLPPDAPVAIDDFYARIHPDDREPTRAAVQRSINERAPYDVLYRTVDPATGAEKWVRAIGRTFYTPDGKPTRFDGVTLDVTEPRRAEEAQRANEARLRFLADLAAEVQSLVDPDEIMAVTARLLAEHLQVDRCGYAEVENEAVYVVTGDYARGVPNIGGRWPVAAFGAKHVATMLAGESYVVEDAEVDARIEPGDLAAYRATNARAAICVPLHKEGKFVAAMAVDQQTPRRWTPFEVDLVRTVVERSWESLERARVARGLRESADRLALALEAACLGDWGWDAGTDVVSLSPRASEIFGLPVGEAVTWTAMQRMLHPDDAACARRAVEAAVAARGQYDVEYRVARPDGREAWVSSRGRAYYDPAGAPLGMFGVVQDVTERKRLEQELRQRAEQLTEADRKKDEFIAMLGHELRNPLAAIGQAHWLMRLHMPRLEGPAGRALDLAEGQALNVGRMLDDLLDVARIAHGKIELRRRPVRLGAAARQAAEAVRAQADARGQALAVVVADEAVALEADPTRLEQILVNLLGNAIKYTPPGGRVELAAGRERGEAVVRVRDDGAGIDAADLPHVFDLFAQAKREGEGGAGGLGLGLTLARQLVELHGGSIHAASAGRGTGAEFTVRLPIAAASPTRAPGPVAARARDPRLRVLVVEDNGAVADGLAMLLEALGHEPEVAPDGPAAVTAFRARRPDLVLCDIGLPGMSGLDVARALRADPEGASVALVALSGYGTPEDVERSLDAGFDQHLAKAPGAAVLEEVLAWAGKRSAP